MTLQQFANFNSLQQMNTLYNKGVYLGKRRYNNRVIFLYQIDSFYIEVFFNPERNKVVKLRSFSSTNLLSPYLDQMSIKHIS